MSDEDKSDYNIPDSFTYSAVGTAIGAIAVLGMVIWGLITPPEVSAMDRPRPSAVFIQLVMDYGSDILLTIMLDTIFVVGYSSLFVGLYLITQDFSNVMAKIALGTGLLVGFFDLVENSLLFVLVHGINAGWNPHPLALTLLYSLNFFIDVLSYATALLFAIILLSTYRPGNNKFIIGILLVLYLLVGLASLVWPAMLTVRSLVFIIGLVYGTIVLYLEEDIPLEALEELINRETAAKNDFIR